MKNFSLRTALLAITFFTLLSLEGWGQVTISALSTDYSQDFNTLTSGNWSNNTTLTGWYARTDAIASITTYAAHSGSNTTAGFYAVGIAGTNPLTDRALGFVASNTYFGSSGVGKGYLGWRLKNNTGSTISSITITWTGEQWRKENNSSSHSINLTYQIGSTVTELNTGSWTSAFSSFTSPITGATTAAVLDGNTTANRTANINVVLSVSIAAGDEIMLRWEDLNDSGTDHQLAIDDITVNCSGSGSSSPGLNSPTAASITQTTATLGATVTGNGGDPITESGIVYGTSANPTGNAALTSPVVTSGAFTKDISSLDPQTLHYYRGYAVNTVGTGYSADGTFRTLSNPPTGQATTLAGTPTSATAINLTWVAATFPGSGATTKGYVLLRATSPNTPSLGNANGAAPTAGANTTIVSSSIAEAAVSQSSASLTANTTYNYLLIPFCWDGTNAATYNYLTASAPTVSVTTPSASSDVVAVASSESATISSLINDDAPLTSSTGVQIWQITVRDGGSAMNDLDNLPTIVSGFTLTQNAGNAVDNWQEAIKTIALFDGSTWIANASSINATSIVFSELSISVNDNSSKTLTLRLSLNPTLNNVGSGNLDGDDFVFNLTNANITILNDGTSSAMSSFTTASSANGSNAIDVVATKLLFVVQPTSVVTNTNMTPSVTVRATDAGGNTDRGFLSGISLTATGTTLTGSPVSSTAAFGVSTFSTLQFSTQATGATLDANYTGLTGATSTAFNVTLGMGSYIYRTLRSGNWDGVTSGSETWERSSDGGSNWATVTSSGDLPNSSASTITIKAGHIVTIAAAANADQLTIEATAQITISSGQTFTIADGTGTDLTVSGILYNSGTLTNNGQIVFAAGGKYTHNNNVTETLQATWDATSTFEETGATSSHPGFQSATTYGNVVWNVPTQNSSVNLIAGLRNIAGNFNIISTGSGTLRFTGSTSYTMAISGNLNIEGGNIEFTSGTGSPTINLSGNLNVSGGTTALSAGGGNGTINLNSGDFTMSAGTLTETSSGTGNINFSKVGAQYATITGGTISNTVNFSVANGTILNIGNSVFGGSGTFTVASGATLKTGHTGGINGAITCSKALNTGGNYEFNGTSAQFTGANFPSDCNNLTINNAAGVSLSAGTSVSGILYLTAGALNIGANTLGISGTISKTDGSLVGGSTSNMSITGAGANLSLPVSTLGNLTINRANGVSMSGDLALAGILTLTNGDFSIGANTLTLNGTCAATSGTLTGGNTSSVIIGENASALNIPAVTLGNLTLNRAAGAVLAGNVNVNTLLTLTNGALTHSTHVLTMGEGATIARTGGSVAMGITFTNAINVTYNQHSVSITPGYEIPNENLGGLLTNLTINSSNGVNFSGSPTIPWVAGTLTINNGPFVLGGQDLKILGSIVKNGGSVDFLSSTVHYETAGAVSILPATYGNLIISGNGTKTLGGDVYVNDVFNLQSTELILDGNQFDLYGTIAGTGTLFGDDVAAVGLGGSGDMGELLFSTGGQVLSELYLLLIDGNSSVTLGTNLHIDDAISGGDLIIDEGVLVVNPGIQLTVDHITEINVPRGLILKANSSAMASFIPGTSIVFNFGGTAVVERYTAAGVVGYFSTPVSGATRNVFAGSVNDRLYQFNATTGGWELLDIDGTALDIMRGYAAKYANPTTLEFEGQLVNGTQTAGSDGHVTLANGGTYGWNLVGNPFASPINVGSQTSPVTGWTIGSDIQGFVSFRRSNGNVAYWNKAGSGTGINSTGIIPPTQAYWINLDGSSSIGYSMTNGVRTHNAQNIYKSAVPDQIFRITAYKNNYDDQAVVGFYSEALNTHERYDAEKMFINDTNFAMVYTVSTDLKKLAINGLSPLQGNRDVVLGFEALKAGNYSFTADVSALDPSVAVSLEDFETGNLQDLRLNPEYSFSSGPINTTSRFILHFNTAKVTGQVVYDHATNPWPVAHAKVKLVNAAGEELSSTTCNANGEFSFDAVPAGSRVRVSSNLPGGGWNAMDALEVMKHFIGMTTLDALPLRAADVNGNGYVNSVDALLIQKRFVSMINSFPAGEWVFEEINPDTTQPGATINVVVKGLCVGDVNKSNQ